MKYFVKTDEVGCIQMILKEPHPMVEDFFELELTEEKYQELMQNIGSYRVNIQGSIPTLEFIIKTPEQILEEEQREQEALMARLRRKREQECFSVVDRGYLWYMQLTDLQLRELKAWYQNWLNVTETLEVPERPEWV